MQIREIMKAPESQKELKKKKTPLLKSERQ